ncbi:MAG: AcrR family transcriptional regulator [Bacteroidia bacterium]|jgi:AcrR family transcriptional regulator
MAMRPRGRPRQNTVLSDETLLEAALQGFGESGYDGTSVREISRGLGVSHNLIPQRFGSKEKLWFAAVDHGFGRLIDDLVSEAEALGDDELLVLRGLVVSFIEINALHPSLVQIINQEANHPGTRLDYLFDTYIQPVRDFGDAWLTRLAEEGKIAPVSVTLMYFLMTHGAGGLFAMPALTKRLSAGTTGYNPRSVRAQVEDAVSVLFDGLISR